MSVQSAFNNYPSYKASSVVVAKNNKTEESKSSALSETAQKYLDNLKAKYGNVNFVVQNYSTDEEASKYLSEAQGDGEYNCIITPSLLEKMAADESVAAEYEQIISGAGEQFDAIEQELGEDAKQVKSYSVSVNDNGEVSYYAILKDGLAKINETRDKMAEKQAQKRKDDKDGNDNKVDKSSSKKEALMVKASTIEDLVAQIKQAIAEKTEGKNKDGFITEKADNKAWGAVGGKKDGFDPNDMKARHPRENKSWHNAHKSNYIDADKPVDFKA